MKASRRAFWQGSLAVVGSVWSATTSAEEPVDRFLQKLAQARQGLRSLRGSFLQERTLSLFASVVKSRGSFLFVAPDFLRWELAPPDAITYWITPSGVGYRSRNGMGRIPKATASSHGPLDDLGAILGGDLRPLQSRYTFRLLDGAQRRDAPWALEAQARAPRKGTPTHIAMGFAEDLLRPLWLTLTFGPKDKTSMVFEAMTVNGPVPAEESTIPALP